MKEHKVDPDNQKRALVDIDETICYYNEGERMYEKAIPKFENIAKINRLYDEGWEITYWTARGAFSKVDYYDFTFDQLINWECKFHNLVTGHRDQSVVSRECLPTKPLFNLVIDDKAKRIEEL